MSSIAVKRFSGMTLTEPGDFAGGRLARKTVMEGATDVSRAISMRSSICAKACHYSQFQRCSSLQYQKSSLLKPCMTKNPPCSLDRKISSQRTEIIRIRQAIDRLSLQFLKMSLQIRKLQGDGPARPFRF